MQLAFNTHKFVKDLTEAGFTERQAEVLADEQINLLNNNLATGTDIATVKSGLEKQIGDLKIDLEKRFNEQEKHISEVKSGLEKQIGDLKIEQEKRFNEQEKRFNELETQIGEVKSELKTNIFELETRLLKWMVGLMIAHAALTITMVVKLSA